MARSPQGLPRNAQPPHSSSRFQRLPHPVELTPSASNFISVRSVNRKSSRRFLISIPIFSIKFRTHSSGYFLFRNGKRAFSSWYFYSSILKSRCRMCLRSHPATEYGNIIGFEDKSSCILSHGLNCSRMNCVWKPVRACIVREWILRGENRFWKKVLLPEPLFPKTFKGISKNWLERKKQRIAVRSQVLECSEVPLSSTPGQ